MIRLGIELVWTPSRETHVQRHGVEPAEVDEAIAGPVLLRKHRGRRLVFGKTEAGRHLLVVIDLDEVGQWFCITARPMVAWERDYFERGGK